MRHKIKVDYEQGERIISIYYSVIGTSVENAIESLRSHVNDYGNLTNMTVISLSAAE
jgi:hypothetical protein